MKKYNLINTSTLEIVNTIMLENVFDYPLQSGFALEEIQMEPPTIETEKTISQVAFLKRFTLSERLDIRASVNPIVQDFIQLLNATPVIYYSDPDLDGGLTYLVSLGLLTSERKEEILA
jgi:hypothetical protein